MGVVGWIAVGYFAEMRADRYGYSDPRWIHAAIGSVVVAEPGHRRDIEQDRSLVNMGGTRLDTRPRGCIKQLLILNRPRSLLCNIHPGCLRRFLVGWW